MNRLQLFGVVYTDSIIQPQLCFVNTNRLRFVGRVSNALSPLSCFTFKLVDISDDVAASGVIFWG